MKNEFEVTHTQQDYISSFFDEAVELSPLDLYGEIQGISRRYTGERQFAAGGMKVITVCNDEATGRLLAKAVMKDTSSATEVESFLREARITASLQHPNILPVYDIGVDQFGRPFFTMKLIEGDSLETVLKKGSKDDFSLEQLIEIFIKVNEAIAYAHSKGVIHLDIKPANIQISDYGEVLVCDWGLAKIIDEDWVDERFEDYSLDELFNDQKTVDGYVKGTLGYLSPEQAQPGVRRDQRSDIYALGALLYEILTDRKPIVGQSLKLVLKKTIEGRIKSPSQLGKIVPRSLEAICMKALKTDPDERYQSANDIIDDLQAYTRGFATDAEEAGLSEQLKLFYRRNTKIMALSLLFVLLFMVALFFFISSLSDKQALAEKERDKALGTLELLQEERQKNTFFGEKFSQQLFNDTDKAYREGNYEQALLFLNYQGNAESQLLKSKILVMQGKYDEAEKCLESIEDPGVKLLKIIIGLFRKPVEIKEEYFLKLFETFKDDPVFEKVLKQQMPLFAFDKRYKCIREMMRQTDNLHPQFKFFVTDERNGYAVDLQRNAKVKSLKYLKYLGKVYSLNISHTAVSSLSELRGISLERLSMANTPVKNLSPLVRVKTLKELFVNENFPKNELKKLSSKVKVNMLNPAHN